MTIETKKKANPDYSNSAVNLVNPPEMVKYLDELHDAQAKVARLDAVLRAMPEYEEMKAAEESVVEVTECIRGIVEALGSYQDQENGFYGVKYQRITKTYLAEPFKTNFPKYALSVIEETVNTKALEGLVKGGLITEADLRTHKVLIETPKYAFYIR